MAILQDIIDAIFGYSRQINGIVPDVVIEEKHTDTVAVTEHPVERGSSINDHIYRKPSELTMRLGWSPSASILNGLISGSIFSGVSSTKEMYAIFLSMQRNAQLISVSTGKRSYSNMAIVSITETTTQETENSLFLTVGFKEVILVNTETTQLSAETQSNPEKTAPVENSGDRVPKPVS